MTRSVTIWISRTSQCPLCISQGTGELKSVYLRVRRWFDHHVRLSEEFEQSYTKHETTLWHAWLRRTQFLFGRSDTKVYIHWQRAGFKFLSQYAHILSILPRFGIHTCKPAITPMVESFFAGFSREQDSTSIEVQLDQQMIGSLLYRALRTRRVFSRRFSSMLMSRRRRQCIVTERPDGSYATSEDSAARDGVPCRKHWVGSMCGCRVRFRQFWKEIDGRVYCQDWEFTCALGSEETRVCRAIKTWRRIMVHGASCSRNSLAS